MIPFFPSELPSPDADPMDIFKTIPSNLRLFLLLLSFAFVLPGIWLVVKKLHDLPIMSVLSSRKKIDLERVLYSFMLWGTVVSAFVFLEYSALNFVPDPNLTQCGAGGCECKERRHTR